MNTVARIQGAGKEYRAGDTVITALQPSTFDMHRHELTIIIGPSGSGKTTLLSLLGCVIYPTQGEVYINDSLVTGLSDRELASVRLYNIGFVFQGFNLLAPLNAVENVMQPLLLMRKDRKTAKAKAVEALEKVNMADRQGSLPKNLSGGQQQRVAIARALVTEPSIILCDEPTAALDVKSIDIVMSELKMLSETGKAVAVVTHDMRLKHYADRIIYVSNGYTSDKPFEE